MDVQWVVVGTVCIKGKSRFKGGPVGVRPAFGVERSIHLSGENETRIQRALHICVNLLCFVFPRVGLGCYADGLCLGPYLVSMSIQDPQYSMAWIKEQHALFIY